MQSDIRLNAAYQASLGRSGRSLQELYNTIFKQITKWVSQLGEVKELLGYNTIMQGTIMH